MATFRKVPVTNNPGRFNICSDEPSGPCDFTVYASMVEEPMASKVLASLQGAEQAAIHEREACARTLWDECEKRKMIARATSTVNVGLLHEIESSTFRWAAQLIEARK